MNPHINNIDAIIDIAMELLEASDGTFWMLAKGESMLPLVHTGDRLQVQPLIGLPRKGEILVIRLEEGLVAHRLLRLTRSPQGMIICLAQGDHALNPDPPIGINQVAGQAIALQHHAREFRLDTPAWQRIGGGVSIFQSIFQGVSGRTRFNRLLRRGIRMCITLTLNLYLTVLKW